MLLYHLIDEAKSEVVRAASMPQEAADEMNAEFAAQGIPLKWVCNVVHQANLTAAAVANTERFMNEAKRQSNREIAERTQKLLAFLRSFKRNPPKHFTAAEIAEALDAHPTVAGRIVTGFFPGITRTRRGYLAAEMYARLDALDRR